MPNQDQDPKTTDEAVARMSRQIALVIAASGLLAIFARYIPPVLGLEPRYEFLFYLFSLAGFFWALVMLWQIWQKRS